MIASNRMLPVWPAWAPERTVTVRVMTRAQAAVAYADWPQTKEIPPDGPPVFTIHSEDGVPCRLRGEFRDAVEDAAEHGLVVARVDFIDV